MDLEKHLRELTTVRPRRSSRRTRSGRCRPRNRPWRLSARTGSDGRLAPDGEPGGRLRALRRSGRNPAWQAPHAKHTASKRALVPGDARAGSPVSGSQAVITALVLPPSTSSQSGPAWPSGCTCSSGPRAHVLGQRRATRRAGRRVTLVVHASGELRRFRFVAIRRMDH